MGDRGSLEIKNIRAYISKKIREIDAVLKRKNINAETIALFKKRKQDLIKSRSELMSKYDMEKRLALEIQCKKTAVELSDEKLLKGLTSFKQEPLSLIDIMDLPIKRARKKRT